MGDHRRMMVTLQTEERLCTVDQINAFLEDSHPVDYRPEDRDGTLRVRLAHACGHRIRHVCIREETFHRLTVLLSDSMLGRIFRISGSL